MARIAQHQIISHGPTTTMRSIWKPIPSHKAPPMHNNINAQHLSLLNVCMIDAIIFVRSSSLSPSSSSSSSLIHSLSFCNALLLFFWCCQKWRCSLLPTLSIHHHQLLFICTWLWYRRKGNFSGEGQEAISLYFCPNNHNNWHLYIMCVCQLSRQCNQTIEPIIWSILYTVRKCGISSTLNQ